MLFIDIKNTFYFILLLYEKDKWKDALKFYLILLLTQEFWYQK